MTLQELRTQHSEEVSSDFVLGNFQALKIYEGSVEFETEVGGAPVTQSTFRKMSDVLHFCITEDGNIEVRTAEGVTNEEFEYGFSVGVEVAHIADDYKEVYERLLIAELERIYEGVHRTQSITAMPQKVATEDLFTPQYLAENPALGGFVCRYNG